MMKFDQDLFISYAHLDNKPLPPAEEGWISRFHEALQAFVSTRMGQEVRIWRDDKLTGTDIFSDEIVDQFRNTALLVSILTPRYVQSEWCSREMREFCEAAKESGGVAVDKKSRLIKVIKTPIENEAQLPDVANSVLGYEFYTRGQGGAPLELDTIFGAEQTQAYYQKVAQLAWDIKQLLDTLKEKDAGAGSGGTSAATNRPAVFLAECSYDQAEQRVRLAAELRTFGYPVLPAAVLPKVEAEQVAAVRDTLDQCELSIHLIGSSYGSIPDGPSGKSNVVLQNELAAARSKSAGMRRIIWIPGGTEPASDLQKQVIASLHTDPEAQYGADLITGDFEQLKSAVHAQLGKLQQEPEIEVRDASGVDTGLLYLICNSNDRKATVPLRKSLKAAGLEARTPAFEGDAASVREINDRLLKTCDALIVFYGSGDEAWKRSVENDIRKISGYGRDKPLKGQFIYLSPPLTADKQDLIDLEEPDILDGLAGFSASQLEPVTGIFGNAEGATDAGAKA